MSYSYLLEFSTLLILFAIAYRFLLSDNKNYIFLRLFCIGSIIGSLLIPLLPSLQPTEIISLGPLTLPTITIIANENLNIIDESSVFLQGYNLFNLFYYLISLVFALSFLYRMFTIYKIVAQGQSTIIQGKKVLLSQFIQEPCSIFNHIILPSTKLYDSETLKTIIEHESYHIQYGHSAEKIFVELIKVLFWFHPVLWYLKREITLIHEYQVDEAMSRQVDSKRYQKTLIELATNLQNIDLVNPFASHIKKRITMMKSINNFKKRSYLFLAVLLVGGSLFLHACQKETAKKELIEKETTKSTSLTSETTKPDEDPNKYHSLETIITTDTTIVFNPKTKEEAVQVVRGLHQHEALFPGCEEVRDFQEMIDCSKETLLTYIYTNLRYPASARDQEIEGVVITKLQVNKNGYLENYEILKSPDDILTLAVETVVQKIQTDITWIPGIKQGKNVNSELILPIKFKLTE